MNPRQQTDQASNMAHMQNGDPALPSTARCCALVATLMGAGFLNTLSTQAGVVVLPTIGHDLNIPPTRQQWIVSAYNLTFACFMLLWGRLADVYGKRSIFILGSAWVTVTTIIIPFMPDEISFDLMRGLQGLGAAANVPTAIGILGVTFPPGKAKIYAFSFYSAGAPLGSTCGIIFGGIVAQYASWKWIFWILAILAALVTLAGYLMIPVPQGIPLSQATDNSDKDARKDAVVTDMSSARTRKTSTVVRANVVRLKSEVDWIGGAIVTMSLVILLFALTEGNVVGWSTPWVPALIVLSLLLLITFIIWQLYLENKTSRRPLMKCSIFAGRTHVSAAMVTMLLFFASFNNYLVFATYFYREYQGLDAIQTALRFLPTGIVGLITILVTSQVLARVDVHYILMFGVTCVGISGLLFAVPISPTTTYWAYGFPAMCLAVFGADTVWPSLTLLTSQALPREDQALGGGLINSVGQLGRAFGLAIGTAIQVAAQAGQEHQSVVAVKATSSLLDPAFLHGLRAAEWFGFGLGMAGLLVVILAFRDAGKVGATRR